jgi:membrane protein implicated in regulation of membrane protease activity
MHGVVAAVVAAAEDGPTVRPSPLASVLFLILLAATILLLWSFVRHLRRAQSNLGSARLVPGATGAPGEVEGDSR